MILTAPYLLFAASAILIPIAIHLWNKRQGKTVKVGSLRWLEASASNRWSSIKLNNFWLLALRCLIFILLAVALAQPVLEHQAQKQKGAKAIVVGEELLYTSALKPIKPTIDSLLQRGYTLHRYTPNLEQVQQEEWQQISNRTQDSIVTSKYNYWSLLPALAEKYKLPQDSVWLFTSDQQQYFEGTRPETMPQHIRWIPVATDKSINWLQAAIQTTPDSLLLILGHSSREGTTYSKYKTTTSAQSINLPGNQQLQLRRQQDTLQATISGNSSNVQVQTEPLQVAILSEEAQQAEVRYIKAAIQAISSYTGLPIQVKADTAKADWIFWLRDEQVPTSINQQIKKGMQVWVQQGQNPQPLNTNLKGTGGTAIKVHQLSQPQPQQQNLVWTAANAEALLYYQTIGRGKVYTFRSAFSPTWSELGQSAQLPELLLPLLLPQPQATNDYRAIDEHQLLPVNQVKAASASTDKTTQTPLLKWFVLAAFVLFLIERIIANRRSKV
ncbi:BatA domain-containing protein [Pontibacter cellulosilyticus]|uniref:BatA domain-containing protein n=1 Tax=Pontibacter cellulosilyticus TaxID=1720253 RepID=A0A923N854_9BACT|nr:BatA domain-containing protein [Pontibacter cellulosilyticus]MBC5993966.1 BatA domain-containing protein [Pontibacter cellulosilyticus]